MKQEAWEKERKEKQRIKFKQEEKIKIIKDKKNKKKTDDLRTIFWTIRINLYVVVVYELRFEVKIWL